MHVRVTAGIINDRGRGCMAKKLIFLDTCIHCRKGIRKFPPAKTFLFRD